MLIKIEELEEGDEIITSSGSDLTYLRILRKPSKTKQGTWKSVKCSIRSDDIVHTNPISGYKYTIHNRICTGEGHNKEVYRQLYYKGMWLVNRKQGM